MSGESFTFTSRIGRVTLSPDADMREGDYPWFVTRTGHKATAYFSSLPELDDACEEISRAGRSVSEFHVPPALFATLSAEAKRLGAGTLAPPAFLPVLDYQRGDSGKCWECAGGNEHAPDCPYSARPPPVSLPRAYSGPPPLAPGTVITVREDRRPLFPGDGADDHAAHVAERLAAKAGLSPEFVASWDKGTKEIAPGRLDPERMLLPPMSSADSEAERPRFRTAADAEEKRRAFAKALDRALPTSMSPPRPGEQCKVCGEAAPMTAIDYTKCSRHGPVIRAPNFEGWCRILFPAPAEDDCATRLEWLNLCPKCGERVASYVAYCCANPHPRSGK